jgi:hypothetical protein
MHYEAASVAQVCDLSRHADMDKRQIMCAMGCQSLNTALVGFPSKLGSLPDLPGIIIGRFVEIGMLRPVLDLSPASFFSLVQIAIERYLVIVSVVNMKLFFSDHIVISYDTEVASTENKLKPLSSDFFDSAHLQIKHPLTL